VVDDVVAMDGDLYWITTPPVGEIAELKVWRADATQPETLIRRHADQVVHRDRFPVRREHRARDDRPRR
jgi:hypothetical protein